MILLRACLTSKLEALSDHFTEVALPLATRILLDLQVSETLRMEHGRTVFTADLGLVAAKGLLTSSTFKGYLLNRLIVLDLDLIVLDHHVVVEPVALRVVQELVQRSRVQGLKSDVIAFNFPLWASSTMLNLQISSESTMHLEIVAIFSLVQLTEERDEVLDRLRVKHLLSEIAQLLQQVVVLEDQFDLTRV